MRLPLADDFRIANDLFLRALGLVYLIAFASLGHQVLGLVGSQGILPIGSLIQAMHGRTDPLHFPTLCWWAPSDGSLWAQCIVGSALAVLLMLNLAPRLCLALMWPLYLSLTVAGQDFYGFQWDALLLETGFLAIFLAPGGWRPRYLAHMPRRAFLLLGWWLMFRLYVESGGVKLLSGDPHWADLTALDYHYWTQPLPNLFGWLAAHLPEPFQELCTAMTLVIEAGLPLLIVGPRRARLVAATGILGLQALIALTGNFAYFNLLTVAIALLLVDDAVWRRVLRWRSALPPPTRASPAFVGLTLTVTAWAIGVLGGATLLTIFPPTARLGEWVLQRADVLDPFMLTNRYGLFANMTTERREIVLEASQDGVHWLAYSFRYKPQDEASYPRQVAPYQPRLDWQLWFAALGDMRQNRWVLHLEQRLLEASPPVLSLFDAAPFGTARPRYVRATIAAFQPASMAAWRTTGQYWVVGPAEPYTPEVELAPDGSLRQAVLP